MWLQGRVQEGLGLFRVEVADQLRGTFEVGKQHRDLLALAFQGAAGGQNFLGKVLWGVGQGSRSCAVAGAATGSSVDGAEGKGSGGAPGLRATPEFPLLTPASRFALMSLTVQVFDVVVLHRE